VGVAEDDDLCGVLAKEVRSLLIESELDQGKMEEQQINPEGFANLEMEGYGIGPYRTGGIDISADINRPVNGLELVDKIETAYISGVKNKRRAVLFKDGEEVGMGPSVRIGKDPDHAAFGLG